MYSPYYEADGITIYHDDCRELLPHLPVGVLVMDPPYGIAYQSAMTGHDGGTALPGISGDADTSLRDWVLREFYGHPAVVFGSWKKPRPKNVRALLIWEKGDHVGMGDLELPWKPNIEEIYIIGNGFVGHRGSSVLSYTAAVTWNSTDFGRFHPHEKPIALMSSLLSKCPSGMIVDPFCGSGSTLVAAARMGRQAIGIEIEEEYCEMSAKRLSQRVLDLGEALA